MRQCIGPVSPILLQTPAQGQGLKTSSGSGPIALSIRPNLEYTVFMNKTTMTSASISMPFQASYDMVCEGVKNIWEAHGLIAAEAELQTEDILSAKYTGENYNNLPMLEVVFASSSAAKVYTAVYLGMDIGSWDVRTDEEVNDYLAYGEFIQS